jgi:imidazole glycerol phosphate synthase glutamine amidotransferase subunit
MPDEPVTVVDYGLGNLFSIERALSHLGFSADITSDPQTIRQAGRVVLPGVGAFGDGMRQLRERGLVEPIQEFASSGRPLLGICLGMQLLFDESEEFGQSDGLSTATDGGLAHWMGWMTATLFTSSTPSSLIPRRTPSPLRG